MSSTPDMELTQLSGTNPARDAAAFSRSSSAAAKPRNFEVVQGKTWAFQVQKGAPFSDAWPQRAFIIAAARRRGDRVRGFFLLHRMSPSSLGLRTAGGRDPTAVH